MMNNRMKYIEKKHKCGGKWTAHKDRDGDYCYKCSKCGAIYYPKGLGVL